MARKPSAHGPAVNAAWTRIDLVKEDAQRDMKLLPVPSFRRGLNHRDANSDARTTPRSPDLSSPFAPGRLTR